MNDNVDTFGKYIGRLLMFIFCAPAILLFSIPYFLICKLRVDVIFGQIAKAIMFGNEKSDPVRLENWIRNLYKDSDNFTINFNKIDTYRKYAFDPQKFPSAHIPVPPNLERGVFHFGLLHNGATKDNWFTGLHFNPMLWADAYDKTRGRALAVATQFCMAMVFTMFVLLSGLIDFSIYTTETWGSVGAKSNFDFLKMISSSFSSVIAIVVCLLPMLLVKKLADKEHDVLALNETMLDIDKQLLAYGGYEASKEQISLAATEGVKATLHSTTLYKQREAFWRVFTSGEPMIYFNTDDGTARARCSIHGYEAGTPMLLCLSELNQNLLATGKIGSGKTTGVALPIFDRILSAFLEKGYPIQGFGLDGKATLYHRLMKILKKRGMTMDRFIPIGVEEGQFGIPIFHGLSVEKCIDILASTTKGDADPFFVPSALSQMERVLRIAKAYHLTPMGVQYEIDTGGCTVDSPEWVKRLCNNPDILFKTIEELTECLKGNDNLRELLYDPSLKSAIDGCLEDWKNMLKAEETASSVISTINVFLKDFTSNGKILERFGQGRVGDMYKDIGLCLHGYFFFSALADTEFGEASRKINIFARSRLFNLVTLREIEYRRAGKDPQKEPVIIFIDEHHLLASSGTTGLSDASILNISRSMGLVFCAMTQSSDAYETVLGEKQTENMVQQMLTRIFLPTKSRKDKELMETMSGKGYELNVYVGGVMPSEGAREQKNGGVIAMPNTKLQKLSKRTPVGIPTTIWILDKGYAEHIDHRSPSFKLFGYFGTRFTVGSGVNYISLINSPVMIDNMKDVSSSLTDGLRIRDSLGLLNEKEVDENGVPAKKEKETTVVGSIISKLEHDEADLENRGRSDGIKEIPLFTNSDLIETGNPCAVMSIPQFGIEHWCRTELEHDYS